MNTATSTIVRRALRRVRPGVRAALWLGGGSLLAALPGCALSVRPGAADARPAVVADAPSADASPPWDGPEPPTDAPPMPTLPPPDCGTPPVPVGGVRFAIRDVTSGAAIDSDGNYYAAMPAPPGSHGVVAIDACGRQRWYTAAITSPPGTRYTGGVVRLTTGGDVLLTELAGDATSRRVFRFDARSGAPRSAYAVSGTYIRTVAVPLARGPLVATSAAVPMNQLDGFDLAGARDWHVSDWSNANECAVAGSLLACLDVALQLDTDRVVWGSAASASFEILDGTLRHPLPPALGTDRIYVALFGISSYVLLARDLRSGAQLFRTMLARSRAGQSDLAMGAPVIGPSGLVYVYLQVHRADGGPDAQLQAYRPDGSRAWAVPAPVGREDFTHYARLLVGRAGVVYLATGPSVTAFDAETGAMRWSTPVAPGVNAPEIALSPDGGLAVHTDDDRLVVLVTESQGLAQSPWPAPRADARNGNAR